MCKLNTIELDICVTVRHQYNDVNNQQDATTFAFINIFKSAIHVPGDKFAHTQEHSLTAYTAFVTMQCNECSVSKAVHSQKVHLRMGKFVARNMWG